MPLTGQDSVVDGGGRIPVQIRLRPEAELSATMSYTVLSYPPNWPFLGKKYLFSFITDEELFESYFEFFCFF